MIVGGISGSIDHRHLRVRDSERFSHVPAGKGVGQTYIGDQKIEFLGVAEAL